MRLIDLRTMKLVEFTETAVPAYAILSHTWEEDEVSFQDFQAGESARLKKGYRKIAFIRDQARLEYLDYAWVDTCCIDKSSSAELSEAINSMWRWYKNAAVCLVFLSDIMSSCPILSKPWLREDGKAHGPVVDKDRTVLSFWRKVFTDSVWFTRGWTLQELIAPKHVKFFGWSGNYIGEKLRMLDPLSEITGVDVEVLSDPKQLRSISIAKRMSWAARRRTTRIEDRAYSLLGIFGISMPMLYGEGSKAFTRLQEEIMKSSSDQTILAWSSRACDTGCLLAESPADFEHDHGLVSWGRPGAYEMTNQGLRLTTRVLSRQEAGRTEYLAVLNCRYESNFGGTLALRLQHHADGQEFHVFADDKGSSPHSALTSSRMAFVSLDAMEDANSRLVQITRQYEVHKSAPCFWLKFTNARDEDKIEVAKFGPTGLFDPKTGILRPPGLDRSPRVSVTLKLPSGLGLLLALGYDEVSFSGQGEYPGDGSQTIPGICAWPTDKFRKDSQKESRKLDRWWPCDHEPQTCLVPGGCINTPTYTEVRDPRGGIVMSAQLRLQNIMGEMVYVVSITIAGDDAPETECSESEPMNASSRGLVRAVEKLGNLLRPTHSSAPQI